MCRCFHGSNLLCMSEKSEVEKFMLPMWPSNLFHVLTPVLQLLQPLLLCVHNHRVSKYDFMFCLRFCVECLKAITTLNINLPPRCHYKVNVLSGIIITLSNTSVNCPVPNAEKRVLNVCATPTLCICLYWHIFGALFSLRNQSLFTWLMNTRGRGVCVKWLLCSFVPTVTAGSMMKYCAAVAQRKGISKERVGV